MIRTIFATAVCLGSFAAAAVVDRPLYFEQRSAGIFQTRGAILHADRIELDGVTLRFIQASKRARLEGAGQSAPSTYVIGNERHIFRAFPKAVIRRIYPGIDAAFYGTPGRLEYDLDLAPGAASGRIRLEVDGARSLRLDDQGTLMIETRSGALRQLSPRVFQTSHGVRREIPSRYVLLAANQVGFRLGKHDPGIPLTIDPVIIYTKYFGGSNSDMGGPVATDAEGNVYVTGTTNSIDFPTTNGSKARFQPPLLAYSNGGQAVTPIAVGTQTSVTAIGGTSDGKVLYVATPDGIFISGNHGQSFYAATAFTPTGTVNAISVDQIDPSRAYLATTAGLFNLNNAGQIGGLNDQGLPVSGNGMVNAASVEISPVNHAVMYTTTLYPNYLFGTTDTGVTWHQLFPSYPGEPAVPQFSGTNITFTLAPNGTDLYVVDGNGIFFKSSDEGMTWQKLSGQYFIGASSITFNPNNPSGIFILDDLGLQESTDGGQTFTTISPQLQPGQNIQSFAMDGSGALYISTYSQIEVSTDNGKTWKTLQSRPNPHTLVSLGGQVFAGVDSTRIPFVTKWSADGSQLLYSTFFGGSYYDSISAISVDAQGEAIIAGSASSPDFPVTKTLSQASPGVPSGFVAKLSTGGSEIIYSSLIGASMAVGVNGLAIDASGSPYITGSTSAPDYPTTANAFQPKPPTAMCQRASGNPFELSGNLNTFAFVSKLSADGSSLAYSTFLTGACGSVGESVAVDSSGEAVAAGFTTSPDFPVSMNAYQSVFPGGPAAPVTLPNPVQFGFIDKLSAAGDKLIAGSFIGGSPITLANAVALDSSGDAYVTGSTGGITPGATPGAYQTKVNQTCFVLGIGPTPPSTPEDAFVLKLDPAFTTAQFLTYIGTGCFTSGTSIVLDRFGDVWVGGTPAPGFPIVAPYQLPGVGGSFVSEFNPDASQLLFSSASDGPYLAEDPSGDIYVSGSGVPATGSLKTPAFSTSVSLVKIDPNDTPPVIINSIGPSATYQKVMNPANPYASAIAPGELIGITGQNLGPSDTVMAQLDQTEHLPYVVSGTSVMFNADLAPIISVQDGLIVCFAPFEVSGPTAVTVTANGQKSTAVRVAINPTAPYILSIVNQDGTVNSADHPAPQGSVVAVYVTGLGLTSPLSQDGSVSGPPLPAPLVPIVANIGNNQVQPQAALAAPGLIAGITQVNVQIPKATYPSNPMNISVNSAEAAIYIAP